MGSSISVYMFYGVPTYPCVVLCTVDGAAAPFGAYLGEVGREHPGSVAVTRIEQGWTYGSVCNRRPYVFYKMWTQIKN